MPEWGDERRRALVVANSEYSDGRLRSLRSPTGDAHALERVLSDPSIGNFGVQLSLNETEALVRRRIAQFFTQSVRDELLLLHLSCHGVKDEDGHLYFATPDTELAYLDSTSVSSEFVRRQVEKSRARRIVLLVDCCYSGAFSRGLGSKAGDVVDVNERLGGRGHVVLTSSSSMEYSFEGDEISGKGAPSIFTSALVAGLETGEADLDGDSQISVDELYDYIFDRVRERTPSQTPTKACSKIQGKLVVAHSRVVGPGQGQTEKQRLGEESKPAPEPVGVDPPAAESPRAPSPRRLGAFRLSGQRHRRERDAVPGFMATPIPCEPEGWNTQVPAFTFGMLAEWEVLDPAGLIRLSRVMGATAVAGIACLPQVGIIGVVGGVPGDITEILRNPERLLRGRAKNFAARTKNAPVTRGPETLAVGGGRALQIERTSKVDDQVFLETIFEGVGHVWGVQMGVRESQYGRGMMAYRLALATWEWT